MFFSYFMKQKSNQFPIAIFTCAPECRSFYILAGPEAQAQSITLIIQKEQKPFSPILQTSTTKNKNLQKNSKAILTRLGLSPWRKTCSKTIKKCCRGTESESNIRPNLREDSISSLTTSLQIFTRLLRSMLTGSRSGVESSSKA